MTTTQKQIEKLTQQFIKEAAPLFYQQAVERATEEIAEGFAGFAKDGFKVTNGHGGNGTKTRTAKPAKTTKRKRSKKGTKRSKTQLLNMQVSVFEVVQKAGSDGVSSAAIQEATKFGPKDLQVPIKKLLATKKIRKKGERNQTTYFARKGATAPTAPTEE